MARRGAPRWRSRRCRPCARVWGLGALVAWAGDGPETLRLPWRGPVPATATHLISGAPAEVGVVTGGLLTLEITPDPVVLTLPAE